MSKKERDYTLFLEGVRTGIDETNEINEINETN